MGGVVTGQRVGLFGNMEGVGWRHDVAVYKYQRHAKTVIIVSIGEKECLFITRITCTTHITRMTLKPKILCDKGVGIITRITRTTRKTRITPGKKIIK